MWAAFSDGLPDCDQIVTFSLHIISHRDLRAWEIVVLEGDIDDL